MKKNIGQLDRVLRFILGVVLLAVLFFVENGFRWIGLLGFVMIGTAFIKFCPIYLPFGISTIKK